MDLIISVGHTLTGKGTGAVGFLNESICTREIGERVKAMLEAMGYNVIYLRVDQSDNDLYDRVSKATASNGTLFIEIHLNAGGGMGVEIFTYGAKEIPEARRILNQIVALGFRNRGIKDGKGLYVIRNTNMPSMLIECCFVDTQEDANLYNADNLAKAIVKGITGQQIQSNTGNTDTIQTPVSIPKQEQSKSPIQKAKEFVGNRCKELQEKLIALGYNCGGYGADNNFGQGTYDSLIQFQKDNGLIVDGLAGNNTFNKLDELINKKSQPKVKSYDFRSLQKIIGAVQDNIAGSETLGRCPIIKYGSNGEIVKWIQNRLNYLGFNCGTADGIFGNMTKQAVILFQQSKGLSSDFVIGNNTWSKLLGL